MQAAGLQRVCKEPLTGTTKIRMERKTILSKGQCPARKPNNEGQEIQGQLKEEKVMTVSRLEDLKLTAITIMKAI